MKYFISIRTSLNILYTPLNVYGYWMILFNGYLLGGPFSFQSDIADNVLFVQTDLYTQGEILMESCKSTKHLIASEYIFSLVVYPNNSELLRGDLMKYLHFYCQAHIQIPSARSTNKRGKWIMER